MGITIFAALTAVLVAIPLFGVALPLYDTLRGRNNSGPHVAIPPLVALVGKTPARRNPRKTARRRRK
jgi:hypothetical protein